MSQSQVLMTPHLSDGGYTPTVEFPGVWVFLLSLRGMRMCVQIACQELRRMTALRETDGGVRGIVVEDVVRRLVARTIAQQLGPQVEAATAPFQFGLSTRAGSECVAHVIQGLCEVNLDSTVMSIDG